MRQIEAQTAWSDTLGQLGKDHLLQSWRWGDFKSRYGWKPIRLAWFESTDEPVAAAQMLYRTLMPGLTMGYCPKGPMLNWEEPEIVLRVLKDLSQTARAQGAFYLKMDPLLDLPASQDTASPPPALSAYSEVLSLLDRAGWRKSNEQVQFKNTVVIDLRPDEEELLAAMKQKTRYNVRLAARKGVEVRQGSNADLELLYQMFAVTSLRDGFVIRSPEYYHQAWGAFIEEGDALPLIASVGGEPVAAIIVFRYAQTAYYLYGMSIENHREKMPTYLLQWEAMRWAKSAGCTTYDMWGAPDVIDPSDPMYGVYKFKEGFGGWLLETPGAFDLPLNRVLYRVYTAGMPVVLSLMRKVGRASTRQSLE
jgi:lipid II:glycine glycyltransferase (peptidoglycan interpeptide bridge formation enzyme)